MRDALFTVNNLGKLALPGETFSDSSRTECRLSASNTPDDCKAVMMEDLIGPDGTNARFVVEKIRVYWAVTLPSQLTRILTNAGGVNATVQNVVDSVVGDCDVCAAFAKAPRVPVAGTPLASAFNEKH